MFLKTYNLNFIIEGNTLVDSCHINYFKQYFIGGKMENYEKWQLNLKRTMCTLGLYCYLGPNNKKKYFKCSSKLYIKREINKIIPLRYK